MKKKYIIPETCIVRMQLLSFVADSIEKGQGTFDPDNMTFSKEGEEDDWEDGVWEE